MLEECGGQESGIKPLGGSFTHIHLDYVRIEFYLVSKNNNNNNSNGLHFTCSVCNLDFPWFQFIGSLFYFKMSQN